MWYCNLTILQRVLCLGVKTTLDIVKFSFASSAVEKEGKVQSGNAANSGAITSGKASGGILS